MDLFLSRHTAAGRGTVLGAIVVAFSACLDSPIMTDGALCDLDSDLLSANRPPNAIPALTEPQMVEPDALSASYLLDDDRVTAIGLYIGCSVW